jgi:hypothetical protein
MKARPLAKPLNQSLAIDDVAHPAIVNHSPAPFEALNRARSSTRRRGG